VTDERLRRAWQRAIGRPSLLAQSHLDAFKDVRGPVDQSDLDALDAELRRAGDGPWLPMPVRFARHTWPQRFGRDVLISGRPVEIAALESFAVTICPPTTQTIMQALDGLRFMFAGAELITIPPGPHEPPSGPLVERLC